MECAAAQASRARVGCAGNSSGEQFEQKKFAGKTGQSPSGCDRLNLSLPESREAKTGRAITATLLIVCVIVFLGSAFFRTQVIRNHDYVLRSDENRMRVIPVPAPRGAILDRNGETIAETHSSYALTLQPTSLDSTRVALALLQPALQLSAEDVAELTEEARTRPTEPLLVDPALSYEEMAWLEEHRPELPDLILDPHPVRVYPDGESVAHLVGYVAEISADELSDTVSWRGYRLGQEVGKAGIERQYEEVLGGELGERYIEVDARGRVIGRIAPRESRQPVPGQALQLTVDMELQRFIHSIFPKDHNGAVVAIEPVTGEVLALYSYPTYDPNLLNGGAEPEVWKALNGNPRRPLLNRATAGIYPPGSTWKLATAIVGLEKQVIGPDSRMPIPCTGGMTYAGRYSRCWDASGHGSLDLAGAIANSCNVYFYQLGIWLGLNQLAQEGTRLGFARPTGIDLPTEKVGTFPSGAEWYSDRFGWEPTPSEVMSLAIGQGPNAQTPVRMAQFFAALAGNGRAPEPRLNAPRASDRTPETDLGLRPETLRALRKGLAQVLEPGGTAYMSSLERWKMYGKTGTSQNTEDPSRPHAWFTGFASAPDGEPEVAVAVVVEFGESGSGAAAPIGAKVADFYMNRKHGLDQPARQTLRERMAAGR